MAIKEHRYHIKLTFREPILGATSRSRTLWSDFIASKAPSGISTDDESETLPEEAPTTTGWTGFHTDEKGRFLYNYVVKGFCKESCGALRKCPGSVSKGLTAYKKTIDLLLFVEPRRLHLHMPESVEVSTLERPLRAQTAQGERVALAKSDTCPPGTWVEFTLVSLGGVITERQLREWFDYGYRHGLGQWRNADWGAFTYEMEAE